MLTPLEVDAERRLAGKYLLHLMPDGLKGSCVICDRIPTSAWEMLRNNERFATNGRMPVLNGDEEKFIWCDGRPVENRNG